MYLVFRFESIEKMPDFMERVQDKKVDKGRAAFIFWLAQCLVTRHSYSR